MDTNFHNHTATHRIQFERFLYGKPLDKDCLIQEMTASSDVRVKDLCRILLSTIGKSDQELAGIEGNLDGYLVTKHARKIEPIIKTIR